LVGTPAVFSPVRLSSICLAFSFLLSILLSIFMLNTVSAAQEVQQPQPQPVHKRAAKAAKKPAPDPPPAPAPPPLPPTLEQLPALPPQVKYSRGQLTIVAENSTLSDILRAVRTQTGAVVEVPPNATERVVTHLGPGPAREVLAALLNGSHFNYVMMGSATHPDSVERLILTSKSGIVPPRGAAEAPVQNPEVQMDDPGTPGQDISEQPVDQQPENAAEDQQPNAQQQVKTPEQLLRELQQQQQIQQQQQQQAPTPPPQGGGPN
jgi:hypothetical protein